MKLFRSGKTTLSASGMLLHDTLYDVDVAKRISGGGNQDLCLVVTVASVVEPFLSQKHRDSISQKEVIVSRPELISGAQIDIMVESNASVDRDSEAPCWVTAQLLTLVDVPESSLGLQSLIEDSPSTPEQGWEVGWSLVSFAYDSMSSVDTTQTQRHLVQRESSIRSLMGRSTTRMAVLGVSLCSKNLPEIVISPFDKRGDFLLVLGSPFGVLSPAHFFNSISVGSIANCYPTGSFNRSLLMADIRCLPGMEGGPVFSKHASLIGILIRPLKQKNSGAEVQLVIPWEAIARACGDLLLKVPQNAEKEIHINLENSNSVGDAFISEGSPMSHFPSPAPVAKAMTSVCLITIDDGVWASGVLLNCQGLVLTNAHLLEPWRFGKTPVHDARNGAKPWLAPSFPESSASGRHARVHGSAETQSFSSKSLETVDTSEADEQNEYKLSFTYKRSRKIRVRLDHADPWIWCDAKVVYVCKGSLDVALLQLEYVPSRVCPIAVDLSCPSSGSKAYVIGHGLFGPKCGFSPSVCSGVIAKIVKAEMPLYDRHILPAETLFPAMIETTAAVHPGSSGGAVVNSAGHMIGLITSNARHGGGTIIPHLNFSIPCAVLTPIFEFAKDMQDFSLLRDLDQPNEHLSSVWALMPQLSPRPKLPLPSTQQSLLENDAKVKGSRFAKFMAERQKLLERPTQLGKTERLSNEIFPSKL
ncbi:glyoxysomal processing protease, glyoxysomal isoform X2 [Tripterygium wilfordii]|uniref:glyoxysomal processing protease, glyoxysomal isoform X2 n=1 Tax=Tripterygium wilfordii TaxID=458696 RepID=UPI0018F84D7A|nr:glyoxysomal processing protease, glyoxysomal isoform X2 [Tripterygium wilfordii]